MDQSVLRLIFTALPTKRPLLLWTQPFCRHRGSLRHGLFFHWSVSCQISDALCWMCSKDRSGNDSDIITKEHGTVRLERAMLWFEKLSRDLEIKSQTSWYLEIFCLSSETYWLKGHLTQRGLFSPLCLIFVFIAHTGWKYFCLLFFFLTDYSTCGRVLCASWFKSSGIVLLWVRCPLDVLPGSYIATYAYHISFLLGAREIWGYYWATGKAPFQKPCIKWFASGFAQEFGGYYTILFPEKVLLSLKTHFSGAGSHFSASWCFVIAF